MKSSLWLQFNAAALMAVWSLASWAAPLTITVLADNQERELFGGYTGYSGKFAQDHSFVAVRSSEGDLFTKYLARTAIDANPESVLSLHLGDVMDYSCDSEWTRASHELLVGHQNPVLIAPGNHDGMFQGNRNYGTLAEIALWFGKWFVSKSYDPKLEGHANWVCDAEWKANRRYQSRFLKRDFVCAYLKENPHLASQYAQVRSHCAMVEKGRKEILEGDEPDITVMKFRELPLATEALASEADYPAASAPSPLRVNVEFDSPAVLHWSKGYILQIQRLVSDSTIVNVVLLDTNDWEKVPRFISLTSCAKANNTNCGAIGANQRAAVDAWLKTVPAGEMVVLAGHYPMMKPDTVKPDTMIPETYQWLQKTLRKPNVIPMYLSAHTHWGYRSPDELNNSSLADWRQRYRTFTFERQGNRGTMCSTEYDPWVELGCGELFDDQKIKVLSDKVQAYSDGIPPDKFDKGKGQWLHRASDARRAMNDFASAQDVPSGHFPWRCEEVKFTEANGFPHIAEVMRRCQRELDSAINEDPTLVRAAACRAIVGAAAFWAASPEHPGADVTLSRAQPAKASCEPLPFVELGAS